MANNSPFMLTRLSGLCATFLLLAFAGGCASSDSSSDGAGRFDSAPALAPPPVAEAPKEQEKAMEAQAPPAPVEETRVAEAAVAPPPPPPPPPPTPPVAPPVVQVPEAVDVHFDYDRHTFHLSDHEKTELKVLAGFLQNHADRVAVIEGHCDERGTSAYNLALGEKRALSVKKYLMQEGVTAAQLQATSFGKERPLCKDHKKACWKKNRRAHVSVQ